MKREMISLQRWLRWQEPYTRYFMPDKVNYGAYGDTGCHLHFHIVPKYKGGEEWGGTFEMNSGRTILTDAEYEEMAEALRQALKEV